MTTDQNVQMRGIIVLSLVIAIVSCGCAPYQTESNQPPNSKIPHVEKNPAEKSDGVKWDARIEASDLEESEFTEICAKAVRSVLDGSNVTVSGPLKLEVKDRNMRSEDIEFTMLLENSWKACRDAPGEREKRLSPYFTNLTEHRTRLEQSTQSIVDHVIPLIRTKAYFGTQEKIEVVSEPCASDEGRGSTGIEFMVSLRTC